MSAAVLFSQMTPSEAEEADFNRWYDEEHVPDRLRIDGFLGAERYRAVTPGPKYAALYEMSSLDVLERPAYVALKKRPSARAAHFLRSVREFTRYTGTQVSERGDPQGRDARFLYTVLFAVPEANLHEFDEWYEQEHLPLLLEEPTWLLCRRFQLTAADPPGPNRLALHYLASLSALDSPQRKRARSTPWRMRLSLQPWFKGTYVGYLRLPARRLLPAEPPAVKARPAAESDQ